MHPIFWSFLIHHILWISTQMPIILVSWQVATGPLAPAHWRPWPLRAFWTCLCTTMTRKSWRNLMSLQWKTQMENKEKSIEIERNRWHESHEYQNYQKQRKDEKIIENIFLIGEMVPGRQITMQSWEIFWKTAFYSAMSQRCLPSSPCRRGVCKMPLEGRDGFQTSDEAELNPPCFHHDFITMNFSSFSSHQDFLMDSWWIAWFELIATFFLDSNYNQRVKKTWWISWLYKPASPAVSRRQMSVTFQIGGETRLWAEFHEFLTPCPKNLKVKGYERCKPL